MIAFFKVVNSILNDLCISLHPELFKLIFINRIIKGIQKFYVFFGIFIVILCCLSVSYPQVDSPVKITKLTSNLYKVTHDVGYLVNSLVSMGKDGLLLVDTGGRETSKEFKDKLKGYGNARPDFIINTHAHIDHTGGNAGFENDPVIIAHKILRYQLQHGTYIIQEYPDKSLPDIMISDSISLHFNGEEIRIIALPGSHSDSDLIVHFTKSGFAYLGDLSYGMSFPSVDYRTGNDAKYSEVLERVINLLPGNTTIISGHGRDCSMDDMREFQKMLEKTTEIVKNAIAESKNVETMQRENILKDWTAFSNEKFITVNDWISDLASDIIDPEPKESIIEPVLIAINEAGPEAGVKEYYKLKNFNSNKYHFHPYRLYQLGKYLTDKKRYKDAIKILELNAIEYPEFWMTFDCLGEAYLKTGSKEEAKKNFKLSLQLNSENINATNQIKLLEREE